MPQLGEEMNDWKKSSFSNGQCACVEFRIDGGRAFLRDSKYRRRPDVDLAAEPVIEVAAAEFEAWSMAMSLDVLPAVTGPLLTSSTAEGGAVVCHRPTGISLTYTAVEWRSFVAGVEADSFVVV